MGGNSRAINRDTGEVKTYKGMQAFASPVDLKSIISLREEFVYFWNDLFDVFYKKTGKLLFDPRDSKSISNSVCYLGSAQHAFGQYAQSEDSLLDAMPVMGDVDVAIPEENIEDLWDVLCSLEEVEFDNSTMVYVGQNRKKLRKPSINAVFSWNDLFLQIDFVAVPFKDGTVDEFVTFAHSSPWEDKRVGIKGVAHKYLLQTIAWAVSNSDSIVILTDKSPLFPESSIKVKKMHEPPRFMSFSVDRGVRIRLQQQFLNKHAVIVDGKYAYKEIATSSSDYTTNVREIFKMFFGHFPRQNDFSDFYSFHGLLRLGRKYLKSDVFTLAIEFLVNFKLYGSGQALSRDSAAEDMFAKDKICNVITSVCGFEVDQKIKDDYYASYKEREISE